VFVVAMSTNSRRVPVFFYGLFMDEEILRSKEVDPSNARRASVDGFTLRIGRRATLVPSPGTRAHGLLIDLTRADVDTLYADPGVNMYRPEPVLCETERGAVAALVYTLLEEPSPDERNEEYAGKLRELARRVGLPEGWVEGMG
jgi:hypothetical protein